MNYKNELFEFTYLYSIVCIFKLKIYKKVIGNYKK